MIELKRIKEVEELKQLSEIQKSAWGFADLDIEPHHLMTRVQKYGGLVQGLYVDNVLVGFTYAIVGKWEGEYFPFTDNRIRKADQYVVDVQPLNQAAA